MQIYFKYILSLISSKNRGLPREAQRSGGFTLIELMVVIAISTIVMTSLIIQQSKWNNRLTINTQTYELALIIRQAQYYSLGVRGSNLLSGDQFSASYGTYIDMTVPNQYIFFIDKNKNNFLDSGETIETNFLHGVEIDRVCGTKKGSEKCSTEVQSIESVGISWFRPRLNAVIIFFNHGGGSPSSIEPPVTIYLKSTGNTNLETSITVNSNGLISID